MKTITKFIGGYDIKIVGIVVDKIALTNELISTIEDILDVDQIREKIPEDILCLDTMDKLMYLIIAGELQININKTSTADQIDIHIHLFNSYFLDGDELTSKLTIHAEKIINDVFSTGDYSINFGTQKIQYRS